MSNRILDYPEATEITSNDYILLDNEGTGAKCIKASALNINMDNYTIKEARGAIASFEDGEDLPLAFMGAYITAIQEGSGDPSPTNERPIIGWDECNVSDINDSTKAPFFKGLLNGTYDFVDLGSLTWYKSGNNTFYTRLPEHKVVAGATSINAISSNGMDFLQMPGNGNAEYIIITDSDYTSYTAAQFKAAMAGIYLIYELGTPTTPTVTPSEISELYEEFGINGNTYSLTFTDGSNPLTVYGGTVDLVSGLLTVDRSFVDLGTLNWAYSSISERFYVGASDLGVKATDASTPFNAISSALIAKSYNEIDAKTVDYAIGINPNATQFFARYSSITSASDFITAMNGVQLVYELATPLTYQLSKQQIKSLVGDNNIFADTGDSVVDYRKLWVTPEM